MRVLTLFAIDAVQYILNGRLLNLLNGGIETKTFERNIQESVESLWDLGNEHNAPDMYMDAIILFTLSAIVPHMKVRVTTYCAH